MGVRACVAVGECACERTWGEIVSLCECEIVSMHGCASAWLWVSVHVSARGCDPRCLPGIPRWPPGQAQGRVAGEAPPARAHTATGSGSPPCACPHGPPGRRASLTALVQTQAQAGGGHGHVAHASPAFSSQSVNPAAHTLPTHTHLITPMNTHMHIHPQPHMLAHPYTQSHTHAHSHSSTATHTRTPIHAHNLTPIHAHVHARTQAYPHPHTLTVSHPHMLTISLTCTLTLTHTHTRSHTFIPTPTLMLIHMLTLTHIPQDP